MEQIFVSNFPLPWLPYLLLHHWNVLANWGSVLYIIFTHFLEACHIHPQKSMKYLLTDMGYESVKQHVSLSYLLAGSPSMLWQVSSSRKDPIQGAQLPISLLFFLVGFLVLGGFFRPVQCRSGACLLSPLAQMPEVIQYLQPCSQVFSPAPPPAQQAQSLLQFHTLQKNLSVKLAAETCVCCTFPEKCVSWGLFSHWWKAGIRMKSTVAPAAAQRRCPRCVDAGGRGGAHHTCIARHTQYIFLPDGASDLLEFNF